MPSKEYYLKNKEEILYKGKIYREKHKVQRNAYFQSESYKEHKKEYDKKYRFKLHSGRIGDEINTKHLVIKNYEL